MAANLNIREIGGIGMNLLKKPFAIRLRRDVRIPSRPLAGIANR